ncbi:MAG: aminoacyl-tRNA hydrolase [Candidatus Magasanikbacteria bacterium]|nr:aminoacyl-tRNA hydrolase [Candidatus Magasanikbacteria bacterium]
MWLVVGLGNPGAEFSKTRHNAGWLAVDFFAHAAGANDWRFDKKYNAEICDGLIDGEKVFFVKPQTFMNLSGESVQAVAAFYKISHEHTIVVHDDLDFPFGTTRHQFDRNAAGHNGVQNIIDRLGTKAFHRIRIGIGAEHEDGREFVLDTFSKEEIKNLKPIFTAAEKTIVDIIVGKAS